MTGPQNQRNRIWPRRWAALGWGLGGVVIVIATVSWLSRANPALGPIPGSPDSAPGRTDGRAVVWAAPTDVVSVVAVPGGVAAESLWHGPATRSRGRAAGFSHDPIGAVIAATNLLPRISAAAGAAVFEPTLRRQCYGDIDAVLEHARAAATAVDTAADAVGPAPVPNASRALFVRVLAGDPTSEDEMIVSVLHTQAPPHAPRPTPRQPSTPLALSTPTALPPDGTGTLSRSDVTLRWSPAGPGAGDWQLRVPVLAQVSQQDTTGYIPLGRAL